jgi:hypothetical protein
VTDEPPEIFGAFDHTTLPRSRDGRRADDEACVKDDRSILGLLFI